MPGGLAEGNRITSRRLLDQSQAGVYKGKRHIPPHFGPFWAYSRTVPQRIELLVYVFLLSLALPRAGQNPCQRREMTVSTNNGVMNGPVHDLLLQFFTLGNSKIEVLEAYFFDTVIT